MKITLTILLALCAQRSMQAITIETVPVGNPGNPPDPAFPRHMYGAVSYPYRIGKYEVTNAQYVQFLNCVDRTGTNTLALYSTSMANDFRGGVVNDSGAGDGFKYSIKPRRAENPVVFVSWYDALRFVNWLHNGGNVGDDTENGAYTMGTLGPDGIPITDNITRNPLAEWFLPNLNEFYKAAFHKNNGPTDNYWAYPTSTNNMTYSDQPPGSGAPVPSNTANFYKTDGISNGYDDGFAVSGTTSLVGDVNYLTDVGAYTLSVSPYGTFDQGGTSLSGVTTFTLSAVERGQSPFV